MLIFINKIVNRLTLLCFGVMIQSCTLGHNSIFMQEDGPNSIIINGEIQLFTNVEEVKQHITVYNDSNIWECVGYDSGERSYTYSLVGLNLIMELQENISYYNQQNHEIEYGHKVYRIEGSFASRTMTSISGPIRGIVTIRYNPLRTDTNFLQGTFTGHITINGTPADSLQVRNITRHQN